MATRGRMLVLWTLATVSFAACRGGSSASDQTETTADLAATVPITTPSMDTHTQEDVWLQLGDYVLGAIPDMFVTGPQIVIYRDGTVFAQIQEDGVADGRVPYHMAMGRLSKSQLSILATDASALPSPTSVSGPVDALADQLTFGGQTWEVPTWETEDPTLGPLLSFVGALRETVHSVAITEWVPERWIVRPYGEPSCTVAARPMQPLDYYEAAVYPHLLDRFPIGPFDCYQ